MNSNCFPFLPANRKSRFVVALLLIILLLVNCFNNKIKWKKCATCLITDAEAHWYSNTVQGRPGIVFCPVWGRQFLRELAIGSFWLDARSLQRIHWYPFHPEQANLNGKSPSVFVRFSSFSIFRYLILWYIVEHGSESGRKVNCIIMPSVSRGTDWKR